MIKIISSKATNFLKKKEKDVLEAYRLGFKIALRDMNQKARKDHRYNRQTGSLERATSSSLNSSKVNVSGKIFIADDIAPHGKYIHEGFKSWNPDQFIYEATRNADSIIVNEIEKQLKKKGI